MSKASVHGKASRMLRRILVSTPALAVGVADAAQAALSGSRPGIARLKSLWAGWLGRETLLLGVAGATVGGMLLVGGSAQAAIGTEPGDVTLSPASGSTSSTPAWSTTVGCPTGYQASADFSAVGIGPGGLETLSISPLAGNSTAPLTGPFSGTLLAPIYEIQSISGIPNGGNQELVVLCFSGVNLTGASAPAMDTFITYSADGSTYTTSATPPNTTTTLTASPNPAMARQTVTLTATVTAADGTVPAGSVQFEDSSTGTDIGSPVAVNSSGVANTTTTFAAAGTQALSAVFTPTTIGDNFSAGTYSETVQAASASSGSEPVAVTVPATGTFTLTVATGTVAFSVSSLTATGALNPITVSDTRNTYPGWSVSGQAADFIGSGTAAGGDIPGNELGWVPTATALATGAGLGPTVTPASPGLGTTAAALASAAAGSGVGTSVLGANLTLDILSAARAGPYTNLLAAHLPPGHRRGSGHQAR